METTTVQVTWGPIPRLEKYDAFVAHLNDSLASSNPLEVAARILDARSRLPPLTRCAVTWMAALDFILFGHMMKGFVFMAVAAHRKQMWLFPGLIVANVRLVFSVILLAFDFPYLANNLNHPLAQSSFVSYRYTLFFVGLRYSLIWPLYWFYLHGVLTHLHVSRAAEGKQLYSPRLFAAAMNLGMFLMPTSVAIAQIAMIWVANEHWWESAVLASSASASLAAVSPSWTAAASVEQFTALLEPVRESFAAYDRSEHYIRMLELTWIVAVSALCCGFFVPIIHHLTLLYRLISIRICTARQAKTTLDVSRAIWGYQPSGCGPQDGARQDDDGTGLHIKSDSVSLLAMIVTLWVLGLVAIVFIALSMQHRLDDPFLWELQYVLGNLILVAMGGAVEALYIWPPFFRFARALIRRKEIEWSSRGSLAADTASLEHFAPPTVARRSMDSDLHVYRSPPAGDEDETASVQLAVRLDVPRRKLTFREDHLVV